MKTHVLIIILLGTGLFAFPQSPDSDFPGDTLGVWTVINFEEDSPYIHIIPSSQNIWQIGEPQKSFFNSAYTVPNAVVTDTVTFYPDNNLSSFDLYVGTFNTEWNYPYDIFIDFRHKFDTDTLKDGGYISVSWDKGLTWMNIIKDTVYYGLSPLWGPGIFGSNLNLYTTENTLYNGEYGFSGRSGGWQHTCITWLVLPVKTMMDFPPDTMIIRFNFVSDNDHHDKEGWMIDQIRIFSIDLGSGIPDPGNRLKRARISPDPLRSSSLVTLDRIYEDIEYSLTDITGRICIKGDPAMGKSFKIDRGNLSPGYYVLKLKLDHQIIETHHILISE